MAHQHEHGHHHGVGAETAVRPLAIALALIVCFMAVEVAIGVIAHSLALLSDAAHMLVDAAALGMSVWAARLALRPAEGRMTFGFRRAEILAAQANAITLLVLGFAIVVEALRRLDSPPHVRGPLVLGTALVGAAVNVLALRQVARANRDNLNVEGSFRHLLTDLYAFAGTAVAGLVVWVTGFDRADPIASLLVAGLMVLTAWPLLRAVGRDPARGRPGRTGARRDRRGPARAPRRDGRPRPARLGDQLRLPGPLGPRARRARRGLPRRSGATSRPCSGSATASTTRRSRSSTPPTACSGRRAEAVDGRLTGPLRFAHVRRRRRRARRQWGLAFLGVRGPFFVLEPKRKGAAR